MSDEAPKLRTGWTTGACATAAAKASVKALFRAPPTDRVRILLPRGEQPEFEIERFDTGPDWAEAAIRKDAGDDPDVTHLALISTRVALAEPGHGIRFHAGPGVGTVTKPGLPIPVGEPAINPVPREMIRGVLKEAAQEADRAPDFDVTISIAGGEELAARTWNPRLGIAGGLSILGTTGIVRPFSCAAWIASIHRGIDVARASNLTHVLGATGATSEKTARALYELPEIACLDMGDFAGGLLKYLRTHSIPRLTIAGGPGKITKLAQGALDLHSGRSQVDFERLAQTAETSGARAHPSANTALEAFETGGQPLATAIARDALATVTGALRGADVAANVLIIDRQGGVLADTDHL
ncbi:MAG: cobalt-precorrin-5B (C(1))-methyltransferase [Pseudomonadota bacterium]